MSRRQTEKQRQALIAPVERAARARGMRVFREYPVHTRRLEGVLDLLVANDSHQVVFVGLNGLDLVYWNMLKTRELGANELGFVFQNRRMARAAQQRVDELKASRNFGSLSIACLSVDAAVELLHKSNGSDPVLTGFTSGTTRHE